MNAASERSANNGRTSLTQTAIAALLLSMSHSAFAINAANGRLDYGLEWYTISADGRGQHHEALTNDWVPITTAAGVYDPTRPTLIYFHGWQPGANGVREDFLWEGPNNQTRRTLDNWKLAGWNVGIFHWNQFADEGTVFDLIPVWVSHAEAKIWSSAGPQGMRYKYRDRGNSHYSSVNPSAEELNLPAMSPGAGRWGDGSRLAETNAVIQFIYGMDPAPAAVNSLRTQISLERGGRTCEQFVEQQACSTSQGIPGPKHLCTSNRPEWREAYLSKVCGKPGVGDMAVLNIMRALRNQSGQVRFAGHSLGHQLATRTAMHLWYLFLHNRNTTQDNFIPISVDLLDPYATSATRAYLANGYNAVSGNVGTPGSTANRVLEYQRRLRSAASETLRRFSATYYLTSALSRTPGATVNHPLISEIPSERVFFGYFSTWNPLNQSAKHTYAPKWFFATQGYLAPVTTQQQVNGEFWPYGLTAPINMDSAYMTEIRTGNVHFAQSRGNDTFTPLDDQFAVCSKSDSRFRNGDYSCGVPQ